MAKTEREDIPEDIVNINEHKLDKECISLPTDYLKVANLSAERDKRVDELKAELEVLSADIAKQIREDPESFGISKVTESAISTTITLQAQYQKALSKLHKAQYDAKLAKSAMWAMETKKRSLTLLVDLHGYGYFSTPKVSGKGKQAVEEQTKKDVRRRHKE